ncbi:MAG: flavodoxin family protein [Oscillospiraceae bacterium]
MKVLIVNGSPHEKGCTFTALSEVAKTLNQEGIETEIFHIGRQALSGCIACGRCEETGKCVFNDSVNVFIDKARNADGFVFGAPVHYASVNGAMCCFMDRVFYAGGEVLRHKPAAAVVSARRAGTTASFDRLNKYFTINEMPVISSQYWNEVHGFTPDDVRQDREGMQIMRTLGRNMAYILKCIEAGKAAGIREPEREVPHEMTNFIR